MNGPHNAKVLFVGDIPSYNDARTGQALAGTAGAEFNRMLAEAGLSRHEVYTLNLFSNRPQSGDVAAYYRHPSDGRSAGRVLPRRARHPLVTSTATRLWQSTNERCRLGRPRP